MMIEQICYACKGRRFYDSFDGQTSMACLVCKGTGTAMAPDEAVMYDPMEPVNKGLAKIPKETPSRPFLRPQKEKP